MDFDKIKNEFFFSCPSLLQHFLHATQATYLLTSHHFTSICFPLHILFLNVPAL